MIVARESIEGLRFVGRKLTDELCLQEFQDGLRRICEACDVGYPNINQIEFQQDTAASSYLAFSVLTLDGNGRPRFTCGVVESRQHSQRECGCEPLVEVLVRPVPWAAWPSWWIPYTEGVFVDHALVPTA